MCIRDRGETDFEKYRISDNELIRDFFVPDDVANELPTKTVTIYKWYNNVSFKECSMTIINSVLIANRGEIAIRIS